MSIFSVTFRIKDDYGRTDRYESTVAAIKKQASGARTWEETTSFFILHSADSAESLARSIYLESKFSSAKDKLVAIILSNNRDHAYIGDIDYPATLTGLLNDR